jgi:hypothetical protein
MLEQIRLLFVDEPLDDVGAAFVLFEHLLELLFVVALLDEVGVVGLLLVVGVNAGDIGLVLLELLHDLVRVVLLDDYGGVCGELLGGEGGQGCGGGFGDLDVGLLPV